jgi:hypothetical protein
MPYSHSSIPVCAANRRQALLILAIVRSLSKTATFAGEASMRSWRNSDVPGPWADLCVMGDRCEPVGGLPPLTIFDSSIIIASFSGPTRSVQVCGGLDTCNLQ